MVKYTQNNSYNNTLQFGTSCANMLLYRTCKRCSNSFIKSVRSVLCTPEFLATYINTLTKRRVIPRFVLPPSFKRIFLLRNVPLHCASADQRFHTTTLIIFKFLDRLRIRQRSVHSYHRLLLLQIGNSMETKITAPQAAKMALL